MRLWPLCQQTEKRARACVLADVVLESSARMGSFCGGVVVRMLCQLELSWLDGVQVRMVLFTALFEKRLLSFFFALAREHSFRPLRLGGRRSTYS